MIDARHIAPGERRERLGGPPAADAEVGIRPPEVTPCWIAVERNISRRIGVTALVPRVESQRALPRAPDRSRSGALRGRLPDRGPRPRVDRYRRASGMPQKSNAIIAQVLAMSPAAAEPPTSARDPLALRQVADRIGPGARRDGLPRNSRTIAGRTTSALIRFDTGAASALAQATQVAVRARRPNGALALV